MKLKQIPEDFVVEEKIKLKTKSSGNFIYFWLTKKNWTTVRAIQEIARQCHTSFKRFKFAGNKDRQAITRQAISAFKLSKEVLENVHLKDIQIEFIGFGDEPINLGTLEGNRFEIVLRDLDNSNSPLGAIPRTKVRGFYAPRLERRVGDLTKCALHPRAEARSFRAFFHKKELKQITANSKHITKTGFPNYFGKQRFGGGNTHLVGREIIRGYFRDAVYHLLTYSEDLNKETRASREFARENFGKWNEILQQWPKFLSLEKAVLNHLVRIPNDFAGALRKVPKPIRRMYVHAYQSYLWNKGVEAVLKSKTKPKKAYPVPGSKTKLGKDKFSQEVKKLLFADNLTLDSFRCARMPELASEGTIRAAVIKPKKLKVGKPERDELNKDRLKVKLSFELPKGVYATELVNALSRN